MAFITILLISAKWYSDNQYKAGYSASSLKYEKEKILISVELDNSRIDNEAAINAITALWLDKKPTEIIKYETIKKEIVKYVDSDCGVSVGTAWLLDSAGKNASLQESKYSTIADAEKKQTSNIRQADIIEICADWAGDYYSVVDQLHALQSAIK